MPVAEALECKVARLLAAGTGLGWLKLPKVTAALQHALEDSWGSSGFSCVAEVSCSCSFTPCYVAGAVEIYRGSCSFVLCYGSGASCSHGTGAHQEASEATAWLSPYKAGCRPAKRPVLEGIGS